MSVIWSQITGTSTDCSITLCPLWWETIGAWRIFFYYIDVTMTTMASRITSLAVVYSNVNSDADQRKHQSSAPLAFVWGNHRGRWIPRPKGQLRGKCFHLMTSSCTEGWCPDAIMLRRKSVENGECGQWIFFKLFLMFLRLFSDVSCELLQTYNLHKTFYSIMI